MAVFVASLLVSHKIRHCITSYDSSQCGHIRKAWGKHPCRPSSAFRVKISRNIVASSADQRRASPTYFRRGFGKPTDALMLLVLDLCVWSVVEAGCWEEAASRRLPPGGCLEESSRRLPRGGDLREVASRLLVLLMLGRWACSNAATRYGKGLSP